MMGNAMSLLLLQISRKIGLPQ